MQFDTPREMYCSPGNTFVADFVGSMNFLTDCKGKDPDSIFFEQYALQTPQGAASPFQGRPVTAAIRPKDIRILQGEQDATNVLRTRIENIEFRGASDRLYLQVLHQEGGHTDRKLEIDIQTDALEDFNLQDNMELRVQLPAEKVLLFPPSASSS
jgi:iron(III) transport system ATP-binding protein